jgi:hypothetical protein
VRQLTSQWHQEEEVKIDKAIAELRQQGKWDEHWDKFNKLGDYGWRDNMDCRGEVPDEISRIKGGGEVPCMSGGYTFSQKAFEQLKAGDLSHDPHNTVKESFQMQQDIIAKSRTR